jgi:hypothetical protein
MYIHAIAQRERAKTVPVPPAPPYWMWKTLTEKFLKYQTLKLKAKYRKQYEHHLTLKEFGPINDKMVRDIKLRDLERIRDAIHLNHAPLRRPSRAHPVETHAELGMEVPCDRLASRG